jgi:hypothetical protein
MGGWRGQAENRPEVREKSSATAPSSRLGLVGACMVVVQSNFEDNSDDELLRG